MLRSEDDQSFLLRGIAASLSVADSLGDGERIDLGAPTRTALLPGSGS